MATILLSAAGAAVGGSIGGTVAGLSSVAIGRAVGATLGRVIDQRLLGQGAEAVETGKVERFRLMQAGDGAAIPQVYGRMRVGGQVIWVSQFQEITSTSGGGKGGSSTPETTQFSYSVSMAVALCEGEISNVARVWADGEEVAPNDLNMRVYRGTRNQLPDPTMEALEGTGTVPAYRGTAYVVMENLPLGRFGNRVPQFSFEVVRPEPKQSTTYDEDFPQLIKGVALVPGTGEYALAETPVHYENEEGGRWAANSNSPSGLSDLSTSIGALNAELRSCNAASLVVSWFGGDLRCGHCQIEPKIERFEQEGGNMPWSVAGVARSSAKTIARVNDRPIYGGTPADASVVEAIRHLNKAGKSVMFYPFILMDQQRGNGLPDPWNAGGEQAHLPWRGRITLSRAPGQNNSPDGTAVADDQVASFFGTAAASDFVVGDGTVSYSGPDEWGLRRFILHYAALCAAAGGVSSFCIGSEMRGLTQIRGASGFVAVQALRSLAAEVRAVLGSETQIGYAADWSEYFGYMPPDTSGDRYFHLDPLWADPNIDFIGIDNYMPLSDWREDETHVDKDDGWDTVYDRAYLESGIEGGEGYDWYYGSAEASAAQIRTPITDGAHSEPWVWRYKDIRNWWRHRHYERVGGVRRSTATAWKPESKPIWFTELGCAAIDKGTNQPNKFLDPKSSESKVPRFSNGARDDFMQVQYLKSVLRYWDDPANNPNSKVYGGRMIDMSNAYVWAWDTRPFPAFPNYQDLWSDGDNYARGHWLNGRVGSRTLSSVVEEICRRSGLTRIDVSRLYGMVRGYAQDQVADARSSLQPLMLRYGFDAIERDGVLEFRMRGLSEPRELSRNALALSSDVDGVVEQTREAEAEMAGRIRVRFPLSEANHEVVAEEAVLPDEATHAAATSDIPISMGRGEGRQLAERWLSEARVSRDSIRFVTPPSEISLRAGDIFRLDDEANNGAFRVDNVEHGLGQLITAVRVEPHLYKKTDLLDEPARSKQFVAPVPVSPLFLDLPLMKGDERPHAPHIAISAKPWPGSVAMYTSASDENYKLDGVISKRSVVGRTKSVLRKSKPGLWDRSSSLEVKIASGALESRSRAAVLNGANVAAIGDGTSANWELIQFKNAELIGPNTFTLTDLLRGQLGSDAIVPENWPKGSRFVLLDEAPVQIGLSSSQRRMARHFRIGPARRGVDDPSYVHIVEAFEGIGLRPYSPCHLELSRQSDGDVKVKWVRRTRVDGDDWDLPDVPLAEESERYLVRVTDGGTILRENEVSERSWIYPASQQAADVTTATVWVEVAQISARFGAGPFTSVPLNI